MYAHVRTGEKKMKSNTKTETCPLPKRIRKRLSVTIDPDHYEFIQEEGINVSRFLDKAINALKTSLQYALIPISPGASADSKKTTKNEASGGNRTRDLFLTKEARYRYATEAFDFQTLSCLSNVPAFRRSKPLKPAATPKSMRSCIIS